MLTPDFFEKAGIFSYSSIANLLQKIEKTGNSSEVEDMVLASVISTHILYNQFIERNDKNLLTGELNKLKIIDDL